jgi:hypothetical protein
VGGCGPILIEDVQASDAINCDRGYTVRVDEGRSTLRLTRLFLYRESL